MCSVPSRSMDTVKAFAPATVANVVCGYDVLGFALESPGDEVTLTLNDCGEVTLQAMHGNHALLPAEPARNVATAVVMHYLKALGSPHGAEVTLYKHMPLNSGMGSSSASSVAALVAINHALGNPLSKKELLPFAMEGERIACGSAHADNVAPCLLGGITLVRSVAPLDVINLPVPQGLFCTVVHPDVDVPTSESRRILKERVNVRDAVTQWGNVGALVAGFCLGDTDLIGRSMEDVIFEPVRAMLIPAFYPMKQAALKAGAIGFGISGSGPSVFALSTHETTMHATAEALLEILRHTGINATAFTGRINTQGATIVN